MLREELVDARYQLAVERTVLNYMYTAGYTDGLAVEYNGEKLHFLGSFNNGMNDALYGGTIATGGTSPFTSAIADLAISARVAWRFDGESRCSRPRPRSSGTSSWILRARRARTRA